MVSSFLGMFFTQRLGHKPDLHLKVYPENEASSGGTKGSAVLLLLYPLEDVGSRPCPFSNGTTMRTIQGIIHCSGQTKTTILLAS